MKEKVFWLLVCFFCFLRPLNLVYQRREVLFSRNYSVRYEKFKAAYESSQYVQKVNPGIIPDQTLESYAGGAFLKGINPILIIHDQPPLGRYLIALSIFLFDNSATLPILLLFGAAYGIYLIARLILKNRWLALIPLAIFVNEPLFMNKLTIAPLLEPIQLPFIILTLYCFLRGVSGKSTWFWFMTSSVMLGFVISIRYFILGLVLLSACLAYLGLTRKFNKILLTYLVSLPLSLVVLVLSYWQTVRSGYSVLKVFSIQKYIFTYHQSAFIHPFSFWDLLLFNRWHTWWGNQAISSDQQWIILWPISILVIIFFFCIRLGKKVSLSGEEKLIFLWVLFYCGMLSVGYTSTRYFLPLLPFGYILATSFLVKLISHFRAAVETTSGHTGRKRSGKKPPASRPLSKFLPSRW